MLHERRGAADKLLSGGYRAAMEEGLSQALHGHLANLTTTSLRRILFFSNNSARGSPPPPPRTKHQSGRVTKAVFDGLHNYREQKGHIRRTHIKFLQTPCILHGWPVSRSRCPFLAIYTRPVSSTQTGKRFPPVTVYQQTRVYRHPLVAGSPRPNPKMGAQAQKTLYF